MLPRFVWWVRRWVLRVVPPAVLRRVLVSPPAYPPHVPIVVHRQHAVGGDAHATVWGNALRAAHALYKAYPHDARVAFYTRRVTTAHAALFR
jgi:hypothetical protein